MKEKVFALQTISLFLFEYCVEQSSVVQGAWPLTQSWLV